MKNMLPLVCCACLVIGGSCLKLSRIQPDAICDETHTEPALAAAGGTPAPQETATTPIPVSQPEAVERPASDGGCRSGTCPYAPAWRRHRR